MRSSQFILLAFVIIMLAHRTWSTPKKIHPMIYNGKDAPIKDFPFQAYLCIPGLFGSMVSGTINCRQLCGGTLISEKYVLTAAHCIVNQYRIRVLLGSSSRQVEGFSAAHLKKFGIEIQDVTSKNIVPHKNFRWDQEAIADIGLLKLNRLVKFSKIISPAQLPKDAESFVGEKAITSGWGRNGNRRNSPDTLKFTTGVIIDQEECKKTYPKLNSGIICFKATKNTGACKGDSGGPLILENSTKVIGVTSFMHMDGCEDGHPFGFTNIVKYLDWVRKNTDVKI